MSQASETEEVVVMVPKKKSSRPKAPPLDPWFGRKGKVASRTHVLFNDATDEVDVLTLAVHSGIGCDSQVTDFIMQGEILEAILTAHKSAKEHSKKATENPEGGTVITRYYKTGERPEIADKGLPIRFEECSGERKPRWAVRTHLIATLCDLLDKSQRQRGSTAGASVSFRGQRRDLGSIPETELANAESEVQASGATNLAKELLTIRSMLHKNAEEGLITVVKTMRELEDKVETERALREQQVTQKTKELVAMRLAWSDTQKELTDQHERELADEEKRRVLMNDYLTERTNIVLDSMWFMTGMAWNLSLALSRCQRGVPVVVPDTQPVPPCEDETIKLRRELADAMMEITRLKDDVRMAAIPKPKARRKTKDPDIHLATEAEMKSAVKAYLSSQSEGFGTPISRASTVASRARRAVGVPEPSIVSSIDRGLFVDRELEEARKLKTFSRLREEDLCAAEVGSEQLGDVIDALSSLLTKVALTVEDLSKRKTEILHRTRSLAVHSRNIANIIKERPYLLPLARRMNHERKPLVSLPSIRALINVAEINLKNLRDIENITLDSVGGVPEAMSLEEAAETGSATQEQLYMPLPVPESTPRVTHGGMSILTVSTLRKHDQLQGL